jgi:hypothetical protein
MPDMIWPPTASLEEGRFHIIVEIWEPLSPSLRKYKLAVLISKMRLGDKWTVHIPDTMDGPYGVFYSSNDKADFDEELLFLRSIKEGRKGARPGISLYGDRLAYTKLTAYSLPMNSLNTMGAVPDSGTMMDLDEDEQITDMNAGTTFENESGIGANSSSQNHRPDSSEQLVHDHQMEDAVNALDGAILELDEEEKAAKEGFDALVQQFELLTGDEISNADSSIHYGGV